MENLATTNVMLGVMAAVSLLEGLLLIGIGFAAFKVYRSVMNLIHGIEQRQVAPAMARVNAILDDVKQVSATVRSETARVDHAIHSTMNRVDDTVDRVRSNVRAGSSRIIGLMQGARAVIETMLHSRAA